MDKDVLPSFFTGFIMGAIVGAAIGFLYAPLTGKDTREIVKEGASKIKARTAEIAEDVKEVAVETVEDVREVTTEAIDKAHARGGEAVK